MQITENTNNLEYQALPQEEAIAATSVLTQKIIVVEEHVEREELKT